MCFRKNFLLRKFLKSLSKSKSLFRLICTSQKWYFVSFFSSNSCGKQLQNHMSSNFVSLYLWCGHNLAKTVKFHIQKVAGCQMFHFFPVTVAENSWKTQMSSNFVFSSCKMVVESRQMAAEILFGPRVGMVQGCHLPAWDLHFATRKDKITRIWYFSSVFCNVTGKKVKHRAFFNFSCFFVASVSL